MRDRERSRFASGRHAGVLVPLFSIPSRQSWGIGEIPDLLPLSRWLRSAAFDFVQLLPVNEMEAGQSSPYSALSAMAVDPIFIALRDVPDFNDAGSETALSADERQDLAAARTSKSVDYPRVRRLKVRALDLAFESFLSSHWQPATPRADALRKFTARERWWLDDYALFRALHEENGARSWLDWSPELRDRDPSAIQAARERLAARILYFDYLQWIADEQWQHARRDCGGIGMFGDFPFMVSSNSADVWARQEEFRIDVSVGVPPDAFSETGQDWGLPACRWQAMEQNDFEWLRNRTRRSAELFDGFRVDHLVGFYRTYMREPDGSACFAPGDEGAQRALGERLLEIFGSQGAAIVAEDLGTVPDFVRESMAQMGIPGMKVFRWEREWNQEGKPFRDPGGYPAASVATSGTHDTESMAEWWESADADERMRAADALGMTEPGIDADVSFSGSVRDALLTALMSSGSNLVILPMQDIFGWRDRINRPAVVGDENWTWRLPMPVEDLMTAREAAERAAFLRELSTGHGRS